MQVFDVQPAALQTITVPLGKTTPTVVYSALLNGAPVSAGWSVDKGNIGTIPAGPSPTATFAPTGLTGGPVTVTAGLNGKTVKRQVMVKITGTQNGGDPTNPGQVGQIPTDPNQITAGGGVGGVGGEGLGVAITDPNVLGSLQTPSGDGSAQGLKLLYPYDATVWPRGMLAPLLMWDSSLGDVDAIAISLETTSGSFSWKGTFGKPAILQQLAKPFIHHPIPQDVWTAATNTAGGATLDGSLDKLVVKLTVSKGGKGYGPIAETWQVAPGRLSGTIYYNSYGTKLAQNYGGAVGGNGMFGGAVLGIKVGDTAPKLVAGSDGGTAQCRVCHSVAAKGASLVVQHGDAYGASSSYDLTPGGSVEHALASGATFPAMYPDGTAMLSPTGQIYKLPDTTNPPAVSGLTAVASNLGTPAFSPDGKRVVFNRMAGPGAPAPGQELLVMDFDPATFTFSNPVTVHTDQGKPAANRPGWPAFLPDGQSVIFQEQTSVGLDGTDGSLFTRKGAKGQIYWASASASGTATPLDLLNGVTGAGTYLPKLPAPLSMGCTADGAQVGNLDADHGDDIHLNYEPTVNPVAAGGFAWIVFTSRRMYGNEATIPPYCSDPRGVDLFQNITTKKLWVAAIDLDPKPGKDPSHPAFYLPAQELLAGNARGFWVLDPCRSDGASCASGDQCCNGYCQPGSGGALVCSNVPPNTQCSGLQEKCATPADCCDSTQLCINGFCSLSKPLSTAHERPHIGVSTRSPRTVTFPSPSFAMTRKRCGHADSPVVGTSPAKPGLGHPPYAG